MGMALLQWVVFDLTTGIVKASPEVVGIGFCVF
jgi:hypothetical protein